MKKLLFIAAIVALFLNVLSFSSCTPKKDDILSNQNTYLNYDFSVGDQINVKQYEIVLSITGNVNNLQDWSTGGILFPNTVGLIHDYVLQVDATQWFKQSKIVYSRIKCIDNDSHITYSKVNTNTNK